MLEKTQQKTALPRVPDIIPQYIRRQKPYTFERTYTVGTITPSTTIDQAGAISFTLNSLPDSSEFTNLFDQYRITQAVVKFVPTSQVSTSSPLLTVLDYDDAVTPTLVTQLYEYSTLYVSESSSYVERALKPQMAVAAYSGAFTSFGSMSDMWIDVASPNVVYYGVKWFNLAQTGNNTSINWDILATITLQTRYIR